MGIALIRVSSKVNNSTKDFSFQKMPAPYSHDEQEHPPYFRLLLFDKQKICMNNPAIRVYRFFSTIFYSLMPHHRPFHFFQRFTLCFLYFKKYKHEPDDTYACIDIKSMIFQFFK